MEWFNLAIQWCESNSPFIAAGEFVVLAVSAFAVAWRWFTSTAEGRRLEKRLVELDEHADKRHHEIMDLRAVIGVLEMKPLGESARYGNLPNGTNIVEDASGKISLALPVRISGGISEDVGGGSARLTVIKAKAGDG